MSTKTQSRIEQLNDTLLSSSNQLQRTRVRDRVTIGLGGATAAISELCVPIEVPRLGGIVLGATVGMAGIGSRFVKHAARLNTKAKISEVNYQERLDKLSARLPHISAIDWEGVHKKSKSVNLDYAVAAAGEEYETAGRLYTFVRCIDDWEGDETILLENLTTSLLDQRKMASRNHSEWPNYEAQLLESEYNILDTYLPISDADTITPVINGERSWSSYIEWRATQMETATT